MASDRTGVTHSVLVSAPYGHDEYGAADYPLLIVLDGNLIAGTAAETARLQASTAEAQEVIVACVGTAAGLEAHTLRRLKDYSPQALRPADPTAAADSQVVQMLERRMAEAGLSPEAGSGGAEAFLGFLTWELLPALHARYRIRTADIGLAGHSGGGIFATYAMLGRARPFRRYIIGSSPGPWLAPVLNRLERDFVSVDDPVQVFFGVGGRELDDPALGPMLRSSLEQMTRLATTPGADIEVRIFPDETHASVMPQVLAGGLRRLWPGQAYAAMARTRFA